VEEVYGPDYKPKHRVDRHWNEHAIWHEGWSLYTQCTQNSMNRQWGHLLSSAWLRAQSARRGYIASHVRRIALKMDRTQWSANWIAWWTNNWLAPVIVRVRPLILRLCTNTIHNASNNEHITCKLWCQTNVQPTTVENRIKQSSNNYLKQSFLAFAATCSILVN
jgi:hypothetical protein